MASRDSVAIIGVQGVAVVLLSGVSGCAVAFSCLQGDSVEFRALQSLTGKLMDVKFLVPGGRFNLLFFLQGIQLDLGKGDMVVISEDLREQAEWWLVALK